jgi:FixJ family two-component response regulator
MPGLSGPISSASWRSGVEIPIIFLTGHATPMTVRARRQERRSLTKPAGRAICSPPSALRSNAIAWRRTRRGSGAAHATTAQRGVAALAAGMLNK